MQIVYVADKNYMPLVEISAKSLLKVNPKAKIAVVSPEPVETEFKNFVIPLNREWRHNENDRITSTTYLKLFLTELPFDKIICLDGDTIVQQPLDELWNMDCKFINLCETYSKKHEKDIGHKYGLSGMMVMNLKNLRTIGYTDCCLRANPQVKHWQHEETLINCALRDFLKFVPVKWNYCYNREYLKPLRQCDVAILHICGQDKSRMYAYQEIREVLGYLKDKRVAIVGNAKSIFDTRYGKLIDSFDVVIRFNRGFILSPEAQGTKTDILFLATELGLDEKASFKAEYYINRSRNTRCGDITISDFDRARLRAWIGKQPSTGFMAIDICEEAGASEVCLFGFDFERTPTFYNPADYKTLHDYDKEEEIIMKKIEIKDGAKTIIKIVADNWEPSDDMEQKDLTTSGRKSIGYSDIPEARWKDIFVKNEN